ncbi:hypothetical protein B0T19DRAFT_119638 [Cercophora scortea]|uniref:Myb-like domain-containing protein n=1 Tax=Cercophora scortea TaxID=314031 RepID=A0AAE0IY46_9PEZI|nr:hypothetical protein B0T19DRAFT_119638 [Cercophora scortea]
MALSLMNLVTPNVAQHVGRDLSPTIELQAWDSPQIPGLLIQPVDSQTWSFQQLPTQPVSEMEAEDHDVGATPSETTAPAQTEIEICQESAADPRMSADRDPESSDDDNGIEAAIRKQLLKNSSPIIPTSFGASRLKETPVPKSARHDFILGFPKSFDGSLLGRLNFSQPSSTSTRSISTKSTPQPVSATQVKPTPLTATESEQLVFKSVGKEPKAQKRGFLSTQGLETQASDYMHSRRPHKKHKSEKEHRQSKSREVSHKRRSRHGSRSSKSDPKKREQVKLRYHSRNYLPNTIDELASREIFRAIKHTPITAGATAVEAIKEIQAAQEKPAASPTTQNNEDLYRMFAAKQPAKQRSQIVNGLPGDDFQQERYTSRQSGGDMFSGRTPGEIALLKAKKHAPVSETHPVKPPPMAFGNSATLANFNNKLPPLSRKLPAPLKEPLLRPASPAPTSSQTQTQLEELVVTPRNGVLVEDLLEGTRVIVRWVVYRTKRFGPDGGKTKIDNAIRCSEYLSRAEANNDARARLESNNNKDVAKKNWELAGETPLFDRSLGFDNGDVQHFWVAEELIDPSKVTNSWRTAGKSLQVDPELVNVYRRQRFDVWSVRISRKETIEVGDQLMQGQRAIVIDCTEESDRDLEINDTGDEGEQKSQADGQTDRENTVESDTSFRSDTARGFPHYENPLDLIADPRIQLHGTFTTRSQANAHALATFLDLARPRNGRIEDHAYFENTLKPEMTDNFNEETAADPTGTLDFEWEPPLGVYKWEFLKLIVSVKESTLEGPIDIGDMVVEARASEKDAEAGRPTENQPRAPVTTAAVSASTGKWTSAEDRHLLSLRGTGKKWTDIQLAFPGRTVGACRKRHKALLDLAPQIRQAHMEEEEQEEEQEESGGGDEDMEEDLEEVMDEDVMSEEE